MAKWRPPHREKGRRGRRRPAGQAPVVPVPVPAGDHHVGAREPTAKAGRTRCRPSLPPGWNASFALTSPGPGSWGANAMPKKAAAAAAVLCWYYSLMMPEDLQKKKKKYFERGANGGISAAHGALFLLGVGVCSKPKTLPHSVDAGIQSKAVSTDGQFGGLQCNPPAGSSSRRQC